MVDFSKISEAINNAKNKVFHKEEEKDLESPSLPETAKDRFGDVDDETVKEENSGSEEESEEKGDKPPEDLPNIDFPDQDSDEGSSQKSEQSREVKEPQPKEEHQITPEKSDSIPSIEDEIKEFENAVSQISGGDIPAQSQDTSVDSSKLEKSFFSEFQRFLNGNDVPKVADELLSKDLMEKMKEYHRHRDEGKPYYFHSDELKDELEDRMMQLRDLEREWFIHKQRLAKEERLLVEKEEEIEDKVEEMKYLMKQIKQRDEFTREAPPEDYFELANGHKLKSLSDLKAALQVMDEDVFKHHIGGKRNDFADWVRNVFDKVNLADKLESCSSKGDMVKVMVSSEGD